MYLVRVVLKDSIVFKVQSTLSKRTPLLGGHNLRTDTFGKSLSAPIGNPVWSYSIRRTPLKTDSGHYFFVPSAVCTF